MIEHEVTQNTTPARPLSGGQPKRYLSDAARFPFCKGCSHTTVLRKLDEALAALQLEPHSVALVTDIGCIGLADSLFETVHTVHTTHGRSTAFAVGIALADSVLSDGKLKVIVLIGDGGATIGLQHLVHAALLNVDVTVVICNNFVYGMTGGQSSCFTPEGFVTTTTPTGNILPPVDLCGLLEKSHAPFVARTTAMDRDVADILREAIAFPGFAAVEVLELCTEFGVPKNELDGKKLKDIAAQNSWQMGILRSDRSRKIFAEQNKNVSAIPMSEQRTSLPSRGRVSLLKKSVSVIVGGSAGERVQSSATFLCQLAINGGLFVTQKNDNPVTQGSGFSLSELWLSRKEIHYTGIDQPDFVLITSDDGVRELTAQGVFERVTEKTFIVADDSLSSEMLGRKALFFPLRKAFGPKNAALGVLCMVALRARIADSEMLKAALAERLKSDMPVFIEHIKELEKLARAR